MRNIPRINILLFFLTFLTTLGAGALQAGVNPLEEPARIVEGVPFSLTLMLILLSHELSHYFSSRVHRTEATLPYFIPAPSIIGTFGAFIKMNSPIRSRKALVDIGASGPLVGFVFSVIASIIGLAYSDVIAVPGQGGLTLGDSLLFRVLSEVMIGSPPEGSDVLLHPMAFAGWIGLFVTSLNLIPVGQLDGGHIAFALLGRMHRYLSMALVGALAVMGLFFWPGWAVWAVLMVILGINHPPVMRWEAPLDRRSRLTSITAFIVFILTFTPVPFNISL